MRKFKKINKHKKLLKEKPNFSLIGGIFLFSLLIGIILGFFVKEMKIARVRAYKARIEKEENDRVEKLVKKIEKRFYTRPSNSKKSHF